MDLVLQISGLNSLILRDLNQRDLSCLRRTNKFFAGNPEILRLLECIFEFLNRKANHFIIFCSQQNVRITDTGGTEKIISLDEYRKIPNTMPDILLAKDYDIFTIPGGFRTNEYVYIKQGIRYLVNNLYKYDLSILPPMYYSNVKISQKPGVSVDFLEGVFHKEYSYQFGCCILYTFNIHNRLEDEYETESTGLTTVSASY